MFRSYVTRCIDLYGGRAVTAGRLCVSLRPHHRHRSLSARLLSLISARFPSLFVLRLTVDPKRNYTCMHTRTCGVIIGWRCCSRVGHRSLLVTVDCDTCASVVDVVGQRHRVNLTETAMDGGCWVRVSKCTIGMYIQCV